MRRTLTITSVVVLSFLSIAAIKFFTDYPNSVPVGSDFFVFQRNQSYINASVTQVKGDWFTSPVFTGNGSIGGSWTANTFFGDGYNITDLNLTYATNNDVLSSNLLYQSMITISNQLYQETVVGGAFIANNNGNGTNTTNWGVSTFQEIDAENFFPTNTYLPLTNSPYLATDGDGKPISGTGLSPTNILLIAGNNITFTTNVDGSVTVSASGSLTITTITNTTIYSATNFSTNLYYVTGKGNTLIVTNVAVYGVQTNFNVAASSAVITKADQVLTNAPNAHGVFTNTATGPPSFGLLQNTELQNSTITIQGSAVALGGSTLAAGSTPAFGGINFTNLGYGLPTNNVGGGAFVFGGPGTAATLYDTNITAATTLKSFDISACGATAGGIKLYVTCSGGTDRILTFPAGCSGAGLGTPPAVTITNAKAAFFDIIYKPGATPVTNVFWSPVY